MLLFLLLTLKFILAPSRAPDLVIAYNTSNTSLVVKWSHLPRQYFRGEPIAYYIYYIPAHSETDYKITSVKYTTNTTTLTGLAVYTMYVVYVSAMSSRGVGPSKSTLVSTGVNIMLF